MKRPPETPPTRRPEQPRTVKVGPVDYQSPRFEVQDMGVDSVRFDYGRGYFDVSYRRLADGTDALEINLSGSDASRCLVVRPQASNVVVLHSDRPR